MNLKTIGIKANYYPEKRNFSEIPVKGYKFEKVLDIYKLIAYPYFKILKKTHPQWLNLFNDFNFGKYNCLHFFNAVSLGNKPWITTFEYFLPRGAHPIGRFPKEHKYIDKVLNALASDSCKKIIAISEHAKQSQLDYLSQYDSEKSKKIISKIKVLHPPQKIIVSSLEDKLYSKGLNLVLVGADFFRKGGQEVLQVIDQLLNDGSNINLTIVSSLQYGDYASKSTAEDVLEVKEIIARHDSIAHHHSLPNSDVLNLFKTADIALLPSYDETYGYSVLEAQACGCPVVTTNGGAFMEINDNDCGWVIDVPLTNNRSIPYTESEKTTFQLTVKQALRKIMMDALNDSLGLRKKGELCLERIKREHSIENAAMELERIYNIALNN
ncbi:MAG: glycosyltransferase family 4 protein [Crocinitomicaceae bacterium]